MLSAREKNDDIIPDILILTYTSAQKLIRDNLSDPHNHNWYPTILSSHVILITSLLYYSSLKFLLVSSLFISDTKFFISGE